MGNIVNRPILAVPVRATVLGVAHVMPAEHAPRPLELSPHRRQCLILIRIAVLVVHEPLKPTIEQEVAIASIALGSHAHPRDLLRRQASPILGGVVPGAQNHLGGEESVRMMVAKATAVLFAHLCPHEPLSLRCRKCTVYYTEYI